MPVHDRLPRGHPGATRKCKPNFAVNNKRHFCPSMLIELIGAIVDTIAVQCFINTKGETLFSFSGKNGQAYGFLYRVQKMVQVSPVNILDPPRSVAEIIWHNFCLHKHCVEHRSLGGYWQGLPGSFCMLGITLWYRTGICSNTHRLHC